MRTQMFRVWALGVAVASLAFGTGCQQREARAAEANFTDLTLDLAANAPPANAPKIEAPAPLPDAVGAPGLEKATNAPPPKMVQAPVLPENLKVSPALEDILKLAQAGVSEDVLLSYITNSTHLFSANSDAIVYLHDLGVSDNVITALITHDARPEIQAQKLAAGGVKPLPAGVALNVPATNVYPPSVAETTPVPAEPTPEPPVETVVQTNYVVQQVEQPASVSYFYSSLAPYGSWVEVDGYGLCWQPTVAVHNSSWRPYADNGRWIWSDYGWYWYSDYSWGWAPFHYGRWCSYPRLGWLWVPDTCWGPSWVSWRYSGSYCGWAPLPVGCYYGSGGLWYGGVSVGIGFSFGYGWSDYCYVPWNRFCDRNVGLHYARGDHARRIHGGTTVVNNYINGDNNTIINRGIGRERVASANRGQVPTATVREASVRANNRREQLVNNGTSMAIMRPGLPEQPARSHVNIPARRVSASADGTASAVPNRGFGATTRGNAVDSSSAIRSDSPATARRGGASRNDTAEPAPERNASTTPTARAETQQPSRSGVGTDRRSRTEGVTTPSTRGSDSTPVRPNAPAVRNFSGNRENGSSGTARSQSEPTVIARNNTPATPAPSNPRTQVRTPATSTPAPNAAAPNSTVRRGEAYRVYANPNSGTTTRSTPAPQTPAVRPTPAPSSPVNRPGSSPSSSSRPGLNSSSSVNRPEPSRSVQSYYSAPAPVRSTPSYSAPARPAPSYSAPPRPSSSYSAPMRSGPSSSVGRSAPSYSAPSVRSSSPSVSSGGGGRVSGGSSGGSGRYSGGGFSGGGGRGGAGGRN